MRTYEDYMECSPMTDGEEIRTFFDEIREDSISGSQAREFRRGIKRTKTKLMRNIEEDKNAN